MTIDEAIKRYIDNAEYERTHGSLEGCLDFKQLANWLKELKQLREQTRWIPVSERLPEEYGEYLIAWTTSQSERSFIEICECEVTSEYDYEHNRFEVEWLLEDYVKAYPNAEVIAWMPLPEPYNASPTGAERSEKK